MYEIAKKSCSFVSSTCLIAIVEYILHISVLLPGKTDTISYVVKIKKPSLPKVFPSAARPSSLKDPPLSSPFSM
jgi:hypothetical protein